jgi:signal transduction histidine kinase
MFERLRADRAVNREPVWFAADALLALLLGYLTVASMRGVGYVSEFGRVEGLGWFLALGPTALITVRRVAPATCLAAAAVFYVATGFDHGEGNAVLAAPFLAYMVAVTRPPRISAVMVAVAAVPSSLTAFYGPGDLDPIPLAVTLVFFGLGWFAGVTARSTQRRADQLAADAEDARQQASETARRAVAEERLRIARELHDAVGHAVNVMVMQAGAARMAAGDERTVDTLRDIERVGRSALSDLDRMLGLLHGDGGDAAPLEPAHGIGDIARLVEDVRVAGADVHLDDRCQGSIDLAVERPISAAAYRIVQEALTNAIKYAGPARIDVSLVCDADDLVVSVVDDGRGAASRTNGRGGRGIAGMHERASVLDGHLVAGPRVGGGFGVEARLPRSKEHV